MELKEIKGDYTVCSLDLSNGLHIGEKRKL